MAFTYWHYYLLSVLLCKISGVLSALYPTQPIADTVFFCGESALITWIDTSRRPHADGIGPLAIKLHTNEDDYVATLAQGVNPVSFSTLVTIPLDLRNDTLYLLRFSAPGLYEDVWTADFAILSDSSNLKSDSRLSSSSSAPPPDPKAMASSTIPGNQIPVKSLLQPTSSSAAEPKHSEITPASTATTDSPGGSSDPPRRNGAVFSRADQLESARFRLMFIVWPAIFGLSMAL